MTFELAVIGGGNMGAALLDGLLASGVIAPADVLVVEPYAPRRAELVERFPGVTVAEDIAACSSVVIAVKPPDVAAVAARAAAAGATRVLSTVHRCSRSL